MKSGMGLFITHNIVRKHRGEIKVKSEVGNGSIFTVTLPRDFRERPAAEDKGARTTEDAGERCSPLDG